MSIVLGVGFAILACAIVAAVAFAYGFMIGGRRTVEVMSKPEVRAIFDSIRSRKDETS